MAAAAVICVLFFVRSDRPDEIVLNGVHFWISIMAMLTPLLTGILAGAMGEQEQEAGACQLMRKSVWKGKNFSVKCLYLTGILTFFILFSVLLLYAGLRGLFHSETCRFFPLLKTGVIFTAGSLFFVPLHLWLGFSRGPGAAAGAGIFGTVIVSYLSSLSVPSEGIWRLLPWSWPMETAENYVGSGYGFGSETGVWQDLAIQGTFFCLLLAGAVVWFERWEGREKE